MSDYVSAVARARCIGVALLLLMHAEVFGAPAEDASGSLRMNADYIAGPVEGEERQDWLQTLRAYRDAVRRGELVDRSIYDQPENQWIQRARTCHFTFLYDRALFDPESGTWKIDSFLDDGEREFGGYDILLLWQAYPRLGIDERSQFDFYHDLPGGLEGVAAMVRQAHARGVKVFTNYNPWDVGTRRSGRSDEEMLVELIARTQMDGVFLDTLTQVPDRLRQALEAVRPGIALCPELHPPIAQLSQCTASWAQWLNDAHPPGLLHLKWLEPRHMQYQIRRWDPSHREEIRSAFFNGSGMMVWENIFGAYNPWRAEDRWLWRRAVAVLRQFSTHFESDAWEPFYPPLDPAFHIHRWPGAGPTVYTVLRDLNDGAQGVSLNSSTGAEPLFEAPYEEAVVYFDLWNGTPVNTERTDDGQVRVFAPKTFPGGMGAILAIDKGAVDDGLRAFLESQRQAAGASFAAVDQRNAAAPVVAPEPVERTPLHPSGNAPEGMVLVPGGTHRFHLTHQRRECGCYPDPGTTPDMHKQFTWGDPHAEELTHAIGPVDLQPFFIDEAAVTNAQFNGFLVATGYEPRHPESFLRHWPDGQMPVALADHPVVYVDIDDARAYARWAGKRLPTELEWQLAAQGPEGRKWPWGNDFDGDRVNQTGRLLPARALPEGRSPYGCYQMSGNVWELTESLRDDGHTRFLMLRGGSYYVAEGSGWYAPSGPQPNDSHTKFIRLWPGLDRCATIGFRCVVDGG